MRDIRFRAWDNDEKQMFYSNEYHPIGEFFNAILPERITERHNIVLEQYTGLKDKNGVEIYEGDILEFVEEHEEGCECEHCFPCRIEERVGVRWVDDGFMLLPLESYFNEIAEDRQGYCAACSAIGRMFSPNHEIPIGSFTKVIGNIHENPDLLKDK